MALSVHRQLDESLGMVTAAADQLEQAEGVVAGKQEVIETDTDTIVPALRFAFTGLQAAVMAPGIPLESAQNMLGGMDDRFSSGERAVIGALSHCTSALSIFEQHIEVTHSLVAEIAPIHRAIITEVDNIRGISGGLLRKNTAALRIAGDDLAATADMVNGLSEYIDFIAQVRLTDMPHGSVHITRSLASIMKRIRRSRGAMVGADRGISAAKKDAAEVAGNAETADVGLERIAGAIVLSKDTVTGWIAQW
jgi:hypothetical protein